MSYRFVLIVLAACASALSACGDDAPELAIIESLDIGPVERSSTWTPEGLSEQIRVTAVLPFLPVGASAMVTLSSSTARVDGAAPGAIVKKTLSTLNLDEPTTRTGTAVVTRAFCQSIEVRAALADQVERLDSDGGLDSGSRPTLNLELERSDATTSSVAAYRLYARVKPGRRRVVGPLLAMLRTTRGRLSAEPGAGSRRIELELFPETLDGSCWAGRGVLTVDRGEVDDTHVFVSVRGVEAALKPAAIVDAGPPVSVMATSAPCP